MTGWRKVNQYAYMRTVNMPPLYAKTFYKKIKWLKKHEKDYWNSWHNKEDHHKIINVPTWTEEKKETIKNIQLQLELEL